MEVNLENILSRDCSSRCRDDRESSSIRRRRRSRSFEGGREGFISSPSQQRKYNPCHFPVQQEKQRRGELQSKYCMEINTDCTWTPLLELLRRRASYFGLKMQTSQITYILKKNFLKSGLLLQKG